MMTIGQVIDELKKAKDMNGRVYFMPLRCVPTTVDSWRGVYAEPAIGWEPSGYSGTVKEYPTVSSLISELQKAIDGRAYGGWKGGEYEYSRSSPLHVDNPGDCTNTEISSIVHTDWETRIIIHHEKD